MSTRYLISNARYLVTVNENNEILENTSLLIEDGKISAINPRNLDLFGLEVIDGSELLVMPGLVNSHTHLAMTLLRGWAEGVDLQGFLEKVWVAEAAIMDPATCALGAELGAAEALLSGTTTTLDMYFHPESTHAAAAKVGLRHVTGPIFFDKPSIDGLTWDERVTAAHRWPQFLEEVGGPFIPTFLMPHSVYTDSLEHLHEVSSIASELSARIHLHVSETEAENALASELYGRTPTEVCLDTEILNSPTTFGHAVHLSQSDIDIAVTQGASVSHCPGSNLKLSSGIADITNYMKQGITVGLGTDSCSSSNDLNMWAVIRLAANLVSLKHGAENVDLAHLLRCATVEGAKALGLEDRIGSIEVGKEADLITIDLRALHLTPVHNVPALLFYAVDKSDVKDVWVNGSRVIANRQLVNVNSDDLRARVHDRVKALN